MKLNGIYRITEGVKVREEEFGLLLVSKATPALALNNDMKAVWELINGENTCEQIILAIKAQYADVNIEAKVIEIFEILIKVGLIQFVKEV